MPCEYPMLYKRESVLTHQTGFCPQGESSEGEPCAQQQQSHACPASTPCTSADLNGMGGWCCMTAHTTGKALGVGRYQSAWGKLRGLWLWWRSWSSILVRGSWLLGTWLQHHKGVPERLIIHILNTILIILWIHQKNERLFVQWVVILYHWSLP
jgi:hypothetical protein